MSEIEEIKEKIDIIEFIGELIPLKKSGRNYVANCPFHSEKTPSFVVSPERQIWHCFGACNEGGDIFKFLMKWENLEFFDALKELAKKAGVKLSRLNIEDKNWKAKSKLYEINHLTSEYYHYLLTSHKSGQKGLNYFKNRRISDKIIKTFMLGYAPMGWRNLFSYLKKKGYQNDDLEKSGVVIKTRDGNYYDRFRGRIMFTLFDHRDNIIGFSGRTLEANPKEAKYINSPETLIYHKGKNLFGLNATREEVRKKNQIIICEGEFDVLSAFQNGIGNIAAVKGTALTFDQLRLIKRYCDEIILAFDMDIAGNLAAKRAIEMAEDFSLNIKVARITSGKDIDEAIKKDLSATIKDLKKTSSIYDFIINSSLFRYPLEDPFSKKRIASEIIPFLAKIQNYILKNHFVKKLAEVLDVSEESINFEIEKNTKKISFPVFGNKETNLNTQKRDEVLEEYLLALIVQSKNPKERLAFTLDNLAVDDIMNLSIRKILSELLKTKFPNLTKLFLPKS